MDSEIYNVWLTDWATDTVLLLITHWLPRSNPTSLRFQRKNRKTKNNIYHLMITGTEPVSYGKQKHHTAHCSAYLLPCVPCYPSCQFQNIPLRAWYKGLSTILSHGDKLQDFYIRNTFYKRYQAENGKELSKNEATPRAWTFYINVQKLCLF